MRLKKLTPLEILHRQKAELQMKSGELTGSIENNAKYLQRHFGVLFRDSMVESAVSKMPPQLQSFTGHLLKKEKKTTGKQDFSARKVAQGIIIGVTEMAPFFLRGKKGAALSILLKQIVKWVRI